GRAKKTGGVLINTFKNQSISFIKTAGFFALWGVLACALRLAQRIRFISMGGGCSKLVKYNRKYTRNIHEKYTTNI
ncbi:MAG: hypothetical protein JXJ22_09560, partial [Bacteroidales bacterium]|nr:hypothetical protein [Bacteroidales bacterium]